MIDPMLATGGSAVAALDLIRRAGGRDVRMICIVAAPEGIALVEQHHPDVHIYTPVIDEGLNAHKFIVPGLGDFGDRLYGTVTIMKPRPTELDAATSAARRAGEAVTERRVAHGADVHRAQQDPRAGLSARRGHGPAHVRRSDLPAARGRDPDPGMGRLMEALLVSFIDHGATPPSTLAARNTATTGAPLRACVAAGVLGFGRYHGGDIESCMQFLDSGLALVREGVGLRDGRRAHRAEVRGRPRDPAGIRPSLPHARSARRAALSDGARARGRGRSHPDDSRRRARRSTTIPTSMAERRRSTSTARSPPSAATSASRRRSPTRSSSSRACPASPRTPTRNASASSRCARSIRRTTATTARRCGGCRSGESELHLGFSQGLPAEARSRWQASEGWALGSAVEHRLHTAGVSGSNPLAPTNLRSMSREGCPP